MEGAFDAAVRANVEKDGQLALLREDLALAAAHQPTLQEAHTGSAAGGKMPADTEISEVTAQRAALQPCDLPIGGDRTVGEGAGSTQLSASSAAPLALPRGQLQPLPPAAPLALPRDQGQPPPLEAVLSLQQLAAGWLGDDLPAGELPQAAPQPDPADAASSGSADDSMPVAVRQAVAPSADTGTPGEALTCPTVAQVLLLQKTRCSKQ